MATRFQEGDQVMHERRGIGFFCGLGWDGTANVDFGEGEEKVSLEFLRKVPEESIAYGNDCPKGSCEG